MRIAVLFSGQGNQQIKHLETLRADASPGVARVLSELIPSVWGCTTPALSELQVNCVAQPLIFGFQMNLWHQFAALLPVPICVAGYSLGEVGACCAAGLCSVEEGLALSADRARYMDQCVSVPCGLIAVLGLTYHSCRSVAERCGVSIAICNGPDHFVLGGEIAQLSEAARLSESEGATRVQTLGVTTASHTRLLESASECLSTCLKPFRAAHLRMPVLSSLDGRLSRTGAAAVDSLARQVSTLMDWDASLNAVLEMQPEVVLEIGPGCALSRMWNERGTGVPARSSEDFRSVAGLVEWVDRQIR